ncbi:hypothetical protein ABPG74_002319 [Tetrahymena malaccensis]
MKQHLYKFRKEYEIRDPDVISRFPKKELKSFIKIECPISTNDPNLKEQEVQQSLKRLRALNGVKEDLVCENCSKKETCKVINFVPEINENSAKTGLSDLLTSMYYFAVEQENKGQVQIETDQDKIEQDIQDSKSGKNKKNQKEKADISIQKYRDCQNESSFYKSCSSANKLTDTMHVLLDDIYNNLGIETKKIVNEYIEEERRRRFMERIYSKIGNDIEQDNKLRKKEFLQKYGQSQSNDLSDDEASEKDLHPLQKKNQKYKKEIQNEDQDGLNEDDQGNFVQVAGKYQRKNNKSQDKDGLLEKIMNTNQQEGKQFNQMRKQYRNQDIQQDGETDNVYHKQKREGGYQKQSDNQRQNQYKYQDANRSKENDKKMSYSDRKGQDYQDRYRSQSKDYQKDYKKRDQSNEKEQFGNKMRQSQDYQKDYKRRDQNNQKEQFDNKMKQSFKEVNDQIKKGKQEKTSFDRLQEFDDSKLSRFMYKDQKEQKAKIEQEILQKAQLKEQRETKKFEDDLKFVQDLVQESDDMLVREEDEQYNSQKQLENISSQRDDNIIEQYENIIQELTLKLKEMQDYLAQEDDRNEIYLEQAINSIKEAHLCPFNCFKGQEIKSVDSMSQIREGSSTNTSKDFLEVQIRDKNLSTPGNINFVQDKQKKANLFLQKKLENAGKEIEKTKQSYQNKLDNLQQTYDQLLLKVNCRQDKEDSQSGQIEELTIKLLEIDEQNKLLKQNYSKIQEFIKEKFNVELSQEMDDFDSDKFSNQIQEWENLLNQNKNDQFKIESELDSLKQDLQIKQKSLSQRESEHDALIQKIAQTEIMLNEYKQEKNHLSEKLQYETQKLNEIKQCYKNDIQEILQLLEGGEKNESNDIQDLKDNIVYQIRVIQRDVQKMDVHKKSLEKLDEENFQMKLEIQKTNSLSSNLEKIRNNYDQLNYKYLQAQEKIMILEQENQRIIREKQTSDEIQVENLKSLNEKLTQELASLHQTRSRENSDLQEKIEKLNSKIQNIKKENKDLKEIIRSRNNTQEDCQEEKDNQEIQYIQAQRLETIEEVRKGESLDSDNRSSFILSLEDKKIDLGEDPNSIHSVNSESDSLSDINSVEEDHKQIFQLNNLKQIKKAFLQIYKKLKDDKVYAEQTAIDTKVQLAEMTMNKDYFEHNFIKLLKKIK